MKRIAIEDIEAFLDYAEKLEKENERLKRIEAAALQHVNFPGADGYDALRAALEGRERDVDQE